MKLDEDYCMHHANVVRILSFALLLPAVGLGAPEGAAEIKPPAVSAQAIPQAGRVEKDKDLAVTLIVLNGSDRELRNLVLIPADDAEFDVVGGPNLAAATRPFGSCVSSLKIKPKSNVAYGLHNMLLEVQYEWSAEGRSFVSMQPVTVAIEVTRRFEDEAKGLPGGSAALFYLLLPVFPAFFTYQIVDRLRKREGLQVPIFGSEYILPAFFIGLLANVLRMYFSMAEVLVGAGIVGGLWPLARWGWEGWQRQKWAFREDDKDENYLRKALLSPVAPRRYVSVTGRVMGTTWSGVRLKQPDGDLVLGATLQVTPANQNDRALAEALVKDIHSGASRTTRRQLFRLVKQGSLTLGRLVDVQQGGTRQQEVVAIDLVGFEQQSSSRTKFLTVTQ